MRSNYYVQKEDTCPRSFPCRVKFTCRRRLRSNVSLEGEAFAGGALGQCVGVKPENGNICAPIDGTVSEVTETAHAAVIQAGEIEILIHAGIHTVNMKGEGFKNHVKLGQVVRRGEPVLTMDLWKVRNSGYDDTVIVAVSNTKDFAKVEALITEGKVKAGDGVLKVSK